jgi:hypothetical protein
MPRDDTEALIAALGATDNRGVLTLPCEIIVNGIRHDAGEYRLIRIGPLPSAERMMEDDHPF